MKKRPDITSFALKEDRYDGVTIESGDIAHTILEFEQEITEILAAIEDKKLLWIKLSIERSDLIPVLTKCDFVFHHCNERDITLVKRLVEDPVIPTAVNHTLGVGVVVFNKKNILVVKDKIWQTYKLPGGFIDDSENISQAVVREVFEETGVEVEFESVVSLGHFSPAQFGESNLYVVSLAKPLTTHIEIKDKHEIIEARWMDVDEYLSREDVLPYNKAIVKNAFLNEKGLKVHNGVKLILKQDIEYELFF
ncbi:NUDIX domain-containing protein [Sulfurimonas sp. HSL-1716]|uniref:NUDIX hydrolase n=1 Tax=Hydrocurvibacter sulfurireducens TaxID=3131937 RepID=UPI0031F734D4